MKRIAVSCVSPACGLSAFCLWLAAIAPAAAQDTAQLQAELDKSRAVIQQLQAELEQSKAVIQQLQADLTRLQRLMVHEADRAPGVKPPPVGPPPKPEDVPPKVDGVIRAIKGEMIEISLGSDDGLKKGHRLDIYRVVDGQGIYVGRMELVKTGATESVGKMVSGFEKKQPQKGDRVATGM